MSGDLTIREACAALGIPRATVFNLLIRKQLSYRLEPQTERFLIPAEEIGAVAARGLAWARAWRVAHPVVRVDLLEDWSD